MSNKERAIELINRIPENKFFYIIPFLEGAAIPEIEEIKPDEWDLKMIEEAKKENDGDTISFEELLKKEGLTYADLQGQI
ncbi:MAG: hypothetical protein Q4B86_07250 [Eubacteriales bacterium]|nr:hypothetical protein [Eubacteriales bacterium]